MELAAEACRQPAMASQAGCGVFRQAQVAGPGGRPAVERGGFRLPLGQQERRHPVIQPRQSGRHGAVSDMSALSGRNGAGEGAAGVRERARRIGGERVRVRRSSVLECHREGGPARAIGAR